MLSNLTYFNLVASENTREETEVELEKVPEETVEMDDPVGDGEIRRFILSIINRPTVIDGGTERVKTENLNQINPYLSPKQ